MRRSAPETKTIKRPFRVALIGTDSLRGQEIKTLLSVKRFPLTSIDFYDPDVEEEYSKLTQFQDEPKVIHHLDPQALDGIDLVFLAAGEEASRTYGRLAPAKGFQAIDLSGTFSGDENVPVVVAGVNDEAAASGHYPLIANPLPATIILASLLHQLIGPFGVTSAVAFILQPASAFDQAGITELADQSTALLSGASPKKEVFKEQVAFNLLSRTEAPDAAGFSRGERQVISEVRRVLGAPAFPITLSIIQAPVFHTYSIMSYVELAKPAGIRELEAVYRQSPLFKLGPRSGACPVSSMSVAGKEHIFIGQIKQEEARPNAFWIWTVADNLTRGSALNALEIAERLQERRPPERARS
jgi:aspartate-semialdehyde dehydrogenase